MRNEQKGSGVMPMRRALAAAGVGALAVVLSACGGGESDPAPQGGEEGGRPDPVLHYTEQLTPAGVTEQCVVLWSEKAQDYVSVSCTPAPVDAIK